MIAEDAHIPLLWERQPGETPKAYAAFCLYRDISRKRSINRAWRLYSSCEEEGKTGEGQGQKRHPAYFEKWSARWNWVERAAAWDDHQRLSRLAKLESKRLEALVVSWDLQIDLLQDHIEDRENLHPDERTRLIEALRKLVHDLEHGDDPDAFDKLISLLQSEGWRISRPGASAESEEGHAGIDATSDSLEGAAGSH